MLFSSMTFVFVFLPIVCLLYFISRKSLHNFVLLAASIIFYAWGEPKYLAIMLLTILINWTGALFIEKYPKNKIPLIMTIVLNLSFLVYFKYFNFILENFNGLFHTNIDFIKVIMPIGISFYTFQAISYVIDVYRGDCKAQKDIYKLALYISLFPQLIAGPIVKYHDVEAQIEYREVSFLKVDEGIKRFIVGLSKKMLLANTLGAVADKIFSQSPDVFSPLIAWIGAFSYSLQLFFDFSGYSDMAIGLGLIFGFRFMENFNYPYISKSVTEFWRRWHISLSTWFKQYVYIPLGGNRRGKLIQYRNLGIVFLLTGIWHGASWNFIIWGIWNGIFIILEKILKRDKISHLYCIFVFLIGWVIFRAENMSYAIKYLKNMFGLAKTNNILYSIDYYIGNLELVILVIAVLCTTPIFNRIKIPQIVVNIGLLLLFIISASAIAASTYNPFIYFRF